MKNNQKGFGPVEVIAIIVIAGFIGFGGWFVWNNSRTEKSSLEKKDTSAPADPRKIYTSKEQGISFKYPNGWTEGKQGFAGLLLDVTFKSPDLVKIQLDNGYRIDAGGEFDLQVIALDPARLDPAYKEAAEEYLGKSSIN